MAVLYWEPPSADFFAKYPHRSPKDYPEPDLEVFDENWDALMLFSNYSTQWRVGANGATGLDYNVFQHELDRMKLDKETYDKFMRQLRQIERQALREMRSKTSSPA